MDSTQLSIIATEISIAKNNSIKSINIANETNNDLTTLRTEVYSLENRLTTLITKVENLCNILNNANLPNVNSSIAYNNL